MMNIKKIILPLLIIFVAVLIRLFPHPPNFAPITAMALFGGAYLNKKYSIAFVFITLLISDYLLLYAHPYSPQIFNFSKIYSPLLLIHGSTIFVYASFLIFAGIGVWLSSHKTAKNIITASLLSSILFFLITNFNFFYTSSLYSKTINGMIQSYIMAIPFFKNTLLGDLFYVTMFFGSFEFVSKFLKQKYAYLHEKRG